MFVTSVFLVVGLASEVIEQRTSLSALLFLFCFFRIVFVPEETLIHNEDSTEDEEIEEGGDFTHQSLSESLKLSDIEETREL